ncbi:MAG TPA: hypothetical protein VKU89_03055 [Solirubrobacteraceae bacterium]|nr:hypothetical protein [Solirubrobacteraceae bacterium]
MSIHDQLVEQAFRRYELQQRSARMADPAASEPREGARSSPRIAHGPAGGCRRVFVLVGASS